MVSRIVDPTTGKTMIVRNPLGEEELEAARKNRERLEQHNRPYLVVDIDDKAKQFARRYYRKQRR